MAGDVIDLAVVIMTGKLRAGVADDTCAGAIATVACTLRRDEHQHAIRVTMHESRYRAVRVLRQRIFHHRIEALQLAPGRDYLPTDGAVRIVRIDQAGEVRRDVEPEDIL